eukprot:200439-Chlamydomonas_euryale.AAC.1
MPCHATPCVAMPCIAMPCRAAPHDAVRCHAMPCHVIQRGVTYCPYTRPQLLHQAWSAPSDGLPDDTATLRTWATEPT